ncbi:c-type cytochrome [Methylophilaceae bacterium]|jgi:cytochrome c5|nr:c-type cytochrome [Methylophilaceae bacterium]
MSEKRKLKGILETVGVVVGSLAGAIIIIVAATTKYDFSQAEESKIVENNTQEDISPVAQVAVANESATKSATKSGSENSISADKIIKANCAMCHTTGLMGSPKIGDAKQWAPRIAQGKDMLINNAIKGIRMMPAKGGNSRLTDEEVAAAVISMANASGGKL